MIRSFYTASAGTVWSQKGLDVTANNIANVSTDGYKAQTATLAALRYTNMRGTDEANLKSGHGTMLSKSDIIYEQGSLRQTGRSLDFALNKEGFFAIQMPDGIKYTRNGNFSLSEKADGSFALVAANGGTVLDENGKPITVSDKNAKLNIGVYVFQNKGALTKEHGNMFVAGEFPGEAVVMDEPGLLKGYLEASSVDLAQEMADMITEQKAFGLNVKMIQISDEIMQTLNSLR
ncbi:MAG: flagellar hook-basal body protein [Clostridia bacterium]|nr:flagellar hook-basal body protein [Clostridia bacterium]